MHGKSLSNTEFITSQYNTNVNNNSKTRNIRFSNKSNNTAYNKQQTELPFNSTANKIHKRKNSCFSDFSTATKPDEYLFTGSNESSLHQYQPERIEKNKKSKFSSSLAQNDILFETFRSLGLFEYNSVSSQKQSPEKNVAKECEQKQDLLEKISLLKLKLNDVKNQEKNLLTLSGIRDEKINSLKLAVENLENINFDTVRERAINFNQDQSSDDIKVQVKRNNSISEIPKYKSNNANQSYYSNVVVPVSKVSDVNLMDRNFRVRSLDLKLKNLSSVSLYI